MSDRNGTSANGCARTCWACGGPRPAHRPERWSCADCWAPPPYSATVRRYKPEAGVYVILADCGLVKIGLSKLSVWRRIGAVEYESRQSFEVLTILWGAEFEVEAWLHRLFADVRDPNRALDEGLHAHTEWLWPTPALWRLVAGEPLIDLDAGLPSVVA